MAKGKTALKVERALQERGLRWEDKAAKPEGSIGKSGDAPGNAESEDGGLPEAQPILRDSAGRFVLGDPGGKRTPSQAEFLQRLREKLLELRSLDEWADLLISSIDDRYKGDTALRLAFLYLGQPAPPTASMTINITARYDPSELMAARQAAIDGQCRLLGPGDATDIAEDRENAE